MQKEKRTTSTKNHNTKRETYSLPKVYKLNEFLCKIQ